MIPDNPIVFLLIGKYGKQEYAAISKYFEWKDNVIFIQISSDPKDKIEDNHVIKLETDVQWNITYDNNYEKALETAVRKTKKHKYKNHGDMNVCIILDYFEQKINLSDICTKIYEKLQTVYFNHVYVDIYYLMMEELIDDSEHGKHNYEFLQYIETLEKKEHIRFIFLISEMRSDEVLCDWESDVFPMVLDSILVGNSSRDSFSGYGIYYQLYEQAVAQKSKILTMGHMALFQPKDAMKKAIHYMLVNYLYESNGIKKDVKPEIAKIQLNDLYESIANRVNELKTGIEHIGYCNNVLGNHKSMLNADLLNEIFYDNHEQYIQLNSQDIKKSCKQLTEQFCQIKLEIWLQEVLVQSTGYILNRNYLEDMVSNIEDCMNGLIEANQKKLMIIQKNCVEWKSTKSYSWKNWLCKFTENGFRVALLSKWADFRLEELACQMMHECLVNINTYLNNWSKKLFDRCSDFNKYCLRTKTQWENLLMDSNALDRGLLEAYTVHLTKKFENQFTIVSRLRRELYSLIVRGDLDLSDMKEFIDEQVVQLYASQLKDDNYYSTWVSQKTKETEGRYLVDNKLLQMRCVISNIEPFLCVIGSKQNEICQYLISENNKEVTIYHCEIRDTPSIIYYQHIESMECLYSYNSYKEKYEVNKT